MRRFGGWAGVVLAGLVGGVGCEGDAARYRIQVDVGAEIEQLADEEARDAAVSRLAAFGPDVIPVLEQAFAREDLPTRLGVIAVVDELSEPAAEPILLRAVEDAEAEVRYEAWQSLARSDLEVPPALAERALRDPVAKVQLAAAHACAAHCSSTTAVERLVEIAVRDASLPNALWALFALKTMTDPNDERHATAKPIVDRLTSAVPAADRLRAAIVRANTDLPVADREPLRVAALDPERTNLRLQALYALTRIADATDVATLKALLFDSQGRHYVFDALDRLAAAGEPAARELLKEFSDGRPPAGPYPPPGP